MLSRVIVRPVRVKPGQFSDRLVGGSDSVRPVRVGVRLDIVSGRLCGASVRPSYY